MKSLITLFAVAIIGLLLFGGSQKLAMDDNTSYVWTIASGDSMSNRLDLYGGRLGAIKFPAAFTGTQVWIYTGYDTARANASPVYFEDTSTMVLVPYSSAAVVGVNPLYSYFTFQYVWFKSLNGSATITQSAARNGRYVITEW